MKIRPWVSCIYLILALLYLPLSFAAPLQEGDALLFFRVVDDLENLVEGSAVYAAAWGPDSLRLTPTTKTYDEEESYSDSIGLARIGITIYVDMRVKITKEDYYSTEMYYDIAANNELVNGRWQPWGATNTVILKRIRNPIPMYAKRVSTPVPVLNAPVGYDLEKGDWVEPHGRGRVPDLLVTVNGQYVDPFNRDLHMSLEFPSPRAGIMTNGVPTHNELPMGSILVSDHLAPVDGYHPSYAYTRRMSPKLSERINMTPRFGQIAYFRVRTEVDDQGQVKKAWYGKMYGDLYCAFDFDKRICLNFTYYLNPDGTQNVEFDPSRNLFSGLKSLEQVDRP